MAVESRWLCLQLLHGSPSCSPCPREWGELAWPMLSKGKVHLQHETGHEKSPGQEAPLILPSSVFHHLTSGMPWSLTSLRAHMILRKILREQRLLIIWMMQFNIPSQNKMSVLINLFHWFCTHLYKYFIRKVITSDTPQQTVLWFKQTTRLHVFQLNVLKSPN